MQKKDILKGLEICSSDNGCAYCPYRGYSARCINELLKDTFKLTKRLIGGQNSNENA